MTSKRQAELERLLRRLRQMALENDKAARLIHVVKRRLMPGWAERAADNATRRTLNYMM